MKKFLKRYIGDKNFYKAVFAIITPIMLQQLMLSLAGYIDNIMINSYGGESVAAYNGVSAANRLMFVLTFTGLGLSATASIFISQYFGAKNHDKIHEAFRISIYSALIFGVLSFFVIEIIGKTVVDSYIVAEDARYYGYRYLDSIKWGTVVTTLGMMIANDLRSAKETVLPLIAGICGIIFNICFNYFLIFGNCGFKELDASGAAIATVLSRVVEVVILIFFAMLSKKSIFRGAFRKLRVNAALTREYVKKGVPLVFNEIMWSFGTILFALFYCWHNDLWYNAYAYSQNISDLFFIVFAGLGSGTGVIIGASLGAGDFESAKQNAYKMKGLAVMMGLVMGILMVATSPFIADVFNPTDETKKIVVSVLCIIAVFIVIYSYNTVNFFILRSGGDSLRAFILDQGATYLIGIPLAAVLGINAVSLGLSLPLIFLTTHVADVIKIFVGNKFVKKEKWVVNLTVDAPPVQDVTEQY